LPAIPGKILPRLTHQPNRLSFPTDSPCWLSAAKIFVMHSLFNFEDARQLYFGIHETKIKKHKRNLFPVHG